MKIVEVNERPSSLVEDLLKAWESSVRATHLFLSNEEIENIKQYVPMALQEIPYLIVAMTDEDKPAGFMGIVEDKLEMLFIDDNQRGKGLGRSLIEYAIANYNINELAVNEQNPQAKGFYEHMGFEVYKRSELDEQGNPYPILFMKRRK